MAVGLLVMAEIRGVALGVKRWPVVSYSDRRIIVENEVYSENKIRQNTHISRTVPTKRLRYRRPLRSILLLYHHHHHHHHYHHYHHYRSYLFTVRKAIQMYQLRSDFNGQSRLDAVRVKCWKHSSRTSYYAIHYHVADLSHHHGHLALISRNRWRGANDAMAKFLFFMTHL